MSKAEQLRNMVNGGGAGNRSTKPSTMYTGQPSVDLSDLLGSDDEPKNEQLQEEIDALRAQIELLQQTPVTDSQNAIIPHDGAYIAGGRFVLSRTGITCPDDMTDDELGRISYFVRDVQWAVQWWGGDLANIYYRRFNTTSIEVAKVFDVESSTLAKWAYVCEKIHALLRSEKLSFSHHYEVASKADRLIEVYGEHAIRDVIAEAERLIDKGPFSVRDMRKYIMRHLNKGNNTPKITLDSLFSKERAPKVTEMRKLYSRAKQGNPAAKQQLKQEIENYRTWLKEVSQTAGLE